MTSITLRFNSKTSPDDGHLPLSIIDDYAKLTHHKTRSGALLDLVLNHKVLSADVEFYRDLASARKRQIEANEKTIESLREELALLRRSR